MAKFIFRLDSYLGLKEKLEEQKKNEYGKAMSKLDEEEMFLFDLNQKLGGLYLDLKMEMKNHIDSNEIKNYNEYISLTKKEIRQQEKVIEDTKLLVEQIRLELVEAVKDRKILDKLKEKDYMEYRKEELLAEQKVTDEIVSYQYNKREDD